MAVISCISLFFLQRRETRRARAHFLVGCCVGKHERQRERDNCNRRGKPGATREGE